MLSLVLPLDGGRFRGGSADWHDPALGPLLTTMFFPSAAPAFTLQPTAQSAALGATATFTATVIGSPPIGFQWQVLRTA